MHPKYHPWLEYVFAHEVPQGREPPWHLDLSFDEPPFGVGSAEDAAALLIETFSRSGTDLLKFSDAQVSQGLWYLANTSNSSYLHDAIYGCIPLAKKQEVIRSIFFFTVIASPRVARTRPMKLTNPLRTTST